MESKHNRVCPVACAGSLDNRIRRWLHNPQKILAPFVREGMHVLDIGCGPGVFSAPLAGMVGNTGKVIAADLQDGMLRMLRERIEGTELEKRVRLVKCEENDINVHERVDFILAFYLVHEIPDKARFFRQLMNVLNDNGRALLIEPKLFHVSRKAFATTTRLAEESGFHVLDGPRVRFSWSALLER
ncbi:MAG: Methyltransferase type 11 [Bacteroidetes bacterium]|nr:Methyltransferase type 11 [Bacteroidota bacterium]